MAGDGILSVSRFVGFCHLLVHIYMSFYWLINTGPRLCAGCVSFCCFCHVIVHIFMAFYSLIDNALKLAVCIFCHVLVLIYMVFHWLIVNAQNCILTVCHFADR